MSKRRAAHPSILVAAALAFATLAGCSSSPSPPSPTPTENPAPMAPGLTLQDCFMPVVLLPLPTELDQSAMPPGFTLVPADPVTYTIEYRGLTCARTDGRDASTGLWGTAWRVVPPPEFMDPNITHYEMSDGSYAQGDARATLLSWVPNATYFDAVVTSSQTSLGNAATGSVESRTSNFTVTMGWSAAGAMKEAGRTYRLFLVNSDQDPFRLVGAIDVTISESSVLSAGTGYIRAATNSSSATLPGKGAVAYSGFSLHMAPVQLPTL